MTAKEYLKSFGKLTKLQEKIVKNTLCYQLCLLSDSFNNLAKEIVIEFNRFLKKGE